ncbi:MAG TPA: hypothetical protein VMS64_01965 [Candidatus Methylomirabilis sp.]|nr:hypothetical protein [Candidatus Methylomirabilis sp.]
MMTITMPLLFSGVSREDLVAAARVLWSLPGFLRHPIKPDEALAVLRQRLAQRDDDFLDLVQRAVFLNPSSPYLKLLRVAGCEWRDLQQLVREEGVEGALRRLYGQGVYLTIDEFKGRRAAVRGSATIEVTPVLLRNPDARVHLAKQTGGSRGSRTPVPMDFRFLRDRAREHCLRLNAVSGPGWRNALWYGPGDLAITAVIYTQAGYKPVRLFVPVDPAASDVPARYPWCERLVRFASIVSGVPLPGHVYVPPEAPLPIVHWMAEVLRSGGTPLLNTYATAAVRVCQAAAEAGVDLTGARFSITGEPLTAARLATIRRAGAEALPVYSTSEVGPVGFGCQEPTAPDDLHLLRDFHAVIQPGGTVQPNGLPPRALLLSSLRSTMPFILLNVCLGDQAELGQRSCGCVLEKLGWTTHVVGVRSFEKLTAGGMTFFDTDLIRVLEEVLPARFAGGPTDYQLIEEEYTDGRPCLRLLVHPALGPLDSSARRHVSHGDRQRLEHRAHDGIAVASSRSAGSAASAPAYYSGRKDTAPAPGKGHQRLMRRWPRLNVSKVPLCRW